MFHSFSNFGGALHFGSCLEHLLQILIARNLHCKILKFEDAFTKWTIIVC